MLAMVTEFVGGLWRTNRPLAFAGWFNVVLLAGSLAGLALDTRQVLGINPWIKPIKFEISVLVFVWTLAWILERAPAPAAPKRRISWLVTAAMVVEMTVIVAQAARGTLSHFNHATPLDDAAFGAMGLFIAVNTAAVAWTLFLYRGEPALTPAVTWGVRLGLVLFLMASLEGFIMIRNQAHTVGAPDGGPGLPFVNWSTQFGDLRPAHFAGLHGIQILPLAGWWLSRRRREAGTGAVVAVFGVLAAAVILLTLQALARQPVVPSL